MNHEDNHNMLYKLVWKLALAKAQIQNSPSTQQMTQILDGIHPQTSHSPPLKVL